MTFKGTGRLWFRPKNTESAPEGFTPRLIAGVVAFMQPTTIEEHQGISALPGLPSEELVEVEMTVSVVGRWRLKDGEADSLMLNRREIHQILTYPAYSRPEEFCMELIDEEEK